MLSALFCGSLVAQVVKNLPTVQETEVSSWVRKIPWRREWQPTGVFLPGKSHGERSYSRWATVHGITKFWFLCRFYVMRECSHTSQKTTLRHLLGRSVRNRNSKLETQNQKFPLKFSKPYTLSKVTISFLISVYLISRDFEIIIK